MAEKFSVRLFNNTNDLQLILDRFQSVEWEYFRKGGCGQCTVTLYKEYDYLYDYINPESSIKVYVDDEIRYTGKLLKVSRAIESGNEVARLIFYGYLTDLSRLIVKNLYENMEASLIIKDILDNYVIPYSDVSYNSIDIPETDYSALSLDLNHSVMDAMSLLASLVGGVEWGVDRNKNFFFKQTDSNIRRVYLVGKDVLNFVEERTDENVFNSLNFFGASGYMTTVNAQLSISKFGRRSKNLFEASISDITDANRLCTVTLKNLASWQRNMKCTLVKTDAFIEESIPLGATCINTGFVNRLTLYGQHQKYGKHAKYGNLKRDQIKSISYKISGGGMTIELSLQDEIPNLGDQQKRVEYELKEVQRR